MSERINVMVVGRGGREHTLAWKLAQSPRVARVWVAPGNGGTAQIDDQNGKLANVALDEYDFPGLINFAIQQHITLTIAGPEAPLAAGIVDTFQAAGLACFGPTKAAAQIEASKAFSKDFMAANHIPSSQYATFTDYELAMTYLHQVEHEVVIKASGLAAGKGVIIPDSLAEAEEALEQIMIEHTFGSAGDEVVIEERLMGQEASVLAFSDGKTVVSMPAAQDHKRIFDGDAGPNTGGMGAYAPAPLITPEMIPEIKQTILQPTVDGLRAAGRSFVGFLYAGLILTETGLQVLEFNCRFGDPEAQVLLPLLETDLLEIIETCLNGTLDQIEVTWRSGAAATVVAASGGYPESYVKGRQIEISDRLTEADDCFIFHAGTRLDGNQQLVTDGGRVLAVTGLGDDLPAAIERAYNGIRQVQFEDIYFRQDIGAKALLSPQD